MSGALRALALSAMLVLAACATRRPEPPPAPPPPPAPATALEAGVEVRQPAALDPGSAKRALEAFKLSCPVLMRRQDPSGLTLPSDWAPLCTEAQQAVDRLARRSDLQRTDDVARPAKHEWKRRGVGHGSSYNIRATLSP